MDYKSMFRQKALENFNLNANKWYKPFCFQKFIYDIEVMCKNANDEFIPKSGKNKLIKLYEFYNGICENPTALTEDDQLAIQEMKDYLKNNRGHAFGYFPYRKKFVEEEIGRFYELSLANKMNIMANKDIILHEIEKKIALMDKYIFENKYIKQKIITPKIRKMKRDWARQKVLCVCGKEYNKSGKIAHMNGKHHKSFIEENKKAEPIVIGENIKLTIEET